MEIFYDLRYIIHTTYTPFNQLVAVSQLLQTEVICKIDDKFCDLS